MPRTRLRIRRAMLVVTLAMLPIVLAAWGVSYWNEIVLLRRVAQVDVDPTIKADAPNMVSQVVGLSCTSVSGSILLKRSVQGSPHRVPVILLNPAQAPGWLLECKPKVGIYPPAPGVFNWRWPASVAVLGVEAWTHASRALRIHGVFVSYWALTLALAGTACWLWWPQRRSVRRRDEGLCPRCGYDRRGLAPAAACPECGASAPASVADAKASPTA